MEGIFVRWYSSKRAAFEITRNDFGNDVARNKSARKVRARRDKSRYPSGAS